MQRGKNYSLSHSWTLWWRVRWLEQCRLQVAAELRQRWRKTNTRRQSIPHWSRRHREGSITQRGASCGQYDQRRRGSTPKTPTLDCIDCINMEHYFLADITGDTGPSIITWIYAVMQQSSTGWKLVSLAWHTLTYFLEMTNQHVQSVMLYWQWSIYFWIVRKSGMSGWNTSLLLLWKTFLKVSTIDLSLILSKTLIFIISCSTCYPHFILALKPCL